MSQGSEYLCAPLLNHKNASHVRHLNTVLLQVLLMVARRRQGAKQFLFQETFDSGFHRNPVERCIEIYMPCGGASPEEFGNSCVSSLFADFESLFCDIVNINVVRGVSGKQKIW